MLKGKDLFLYPCPFMADIKKEIPKQLYVSKELMDFINYIFTHPKCPHRKIFIEEKALTPNVLDSLCQSLLRTYKYYTMYPNQFGGDPKYIVGALFHNMKNALYSLAKLKGIVPKRYMSVRLKWVNRHYEQLLEILNDYELKEKPPYVYTRKYKIRKKTFFVDAQEITEDFIRECEEHDYFFKHST